MTFIQRLLSFVPPTLLLIVPAFTQVQGLLELLPDNSIRFSVVPQVDWTASQSVTSSAQVTLRATAGGLQISNFQSINGNWTTENPIQSPSEAPAYDYFTFSLNAPLNTLTYQNGTPVPFFSFNNAGGCTTIEIIDTQTDPFMPPNSMNVNIGNSFSIIGAGIGQNAYSGNAPSSSVVCPPLGASASALQNPVSCNGDRTSISVQALGGSSPYDVEYQNLTNGESGNGTIATYNGQLDLSEMAAGDYLFTITDGTDSVTQYYYTVATPAPLEIFLDAFDASCNGSLDGVAFVDDVNGGTAAGDYQYFWETNPDVSSVSAGFLDPGTYSVTVQDDNGCQTQGSVEIGTFAVIYPNPFVTDIKCNGADNGVIDIYPVGVNPPFTYTWSANVTTGDYSSAWQLPPGEYSVTITDATGVCFETDTFSIVEPPAIEVDYQMDAPVCYDDIAYLHILGVSDAVEPWTASVTSGTNPGNPKDFEVEAGIVQYLVIEDARGCIQKEEFLIPAKDELFLELGDNISIKYGEEVQFDPDVYPLDNVTFSWSPGVGLSCDDCPNPVARPLESVTYRLLMADTAGCMMDDKINIVVRKSRDIYIPNAFSPNSDGINDVFCPYAGFEVVAIKDLRVFNRWGGLIYEMNETLPPGDPACGWDGSGKGKLMDTGTYLYSMNVEFIDGEVVLFAGEVNLMR
jgi:gliding motility-associated-like protein